MAPFILLAACSSSSSHSGTETLSASVLGKAAAADLNSNGSLSFPEGRLAGPVTGTIKPFDLGGGNSCTGHTTWLTSAGPLTVTHTSEPVYCAKGNAPPPGTTWSKSGRTCHFAAVFSRGTFTQLSGAFTATTWHGTYAVTATGYAELSKNETQCSFPDTGKVQASGASVVFTASGTLSK